MYYWDGARWISTLSPDGRYRWNGTSWVAAVTQGYVPAPVQPAPRRREPTSWTRPMQYAVAAWYGMSALFTLTVPLFMGPLMSQIMDESFQRQEQLNPEVSPPPAELVQAMTSFMDVAVWISAFVGVVICGVFIVGALKRWTWAFYVVLVLLGISTVTGPLNLVNILVPSYRESAGYGFPTAFYVISLVLWIPASALFVWMVIAAIKRGPWAQRRVS
jgi:hypothetical protein